MPVKGRAPRGDDVPADSSLTDAGDPPLLPRSRARSPAPRLLSLVLACTHAATPRRPRPRRPAGPGLRRRPHRIRALAEEYWEGQLKLDPLLATQVGDPRYDDRLPDTLSDAGP